MDDGGTEQGVLHLSLNDAAILTAALRQYEPYWRPEDPDHSDELGALVRDIMRLLAELRPLEPVGTPGRLGTFQTE
jgi:hypothetical protein